MNLFTKRSWEVLCQLCWSVRKIMIGGVTHSNLCTVLRKVYLGSLKVMTTKKAPLRQAIAAIDCYKYHSHHLILLPSFKPSKMKTTCSTTISTLLDVHITLHYWPGWWYQEAASNSICLDWSSTTGECLQCCVPFQVYRPLCFCSCYQKALHFCCMWVNVIIKCQI